MIRQPIYHGNVNASGIFFPAPNNETSKDIDKSIDKDFAHPSDCAISFSWCGKAKSIPPP